MRTARLLGAIGLAVTLAGGAGAQSLRIGFDTEWTSIDPHFHSFPHNLSISHHVFDALIGTDAQLRLVPGLATSWRAIDAKTWEFKLRPGVKFHDGADFGAEDVAATLARIPKVPNSPGPITTFTRPITSWQVVDPHTIRLVTNEPSPILLEMLTNVYIVPRHLAEATTEQFNAGKATIGTGPYRFVEWSRGARLTLERNDAYWGTKASWPRVEIRILTNTAAREAALLSRDVDFILSPSTISLERLSKDPNIAVHKAPSTRITYLQFNQGTEILPDLKGTDGRNPFADPRVRKAVSMAIPREAIAERIMDGLSLPAGQLIAPGQFGHNPAIKIERYDIDGARKLLAEAGWAKGFEVALATPSDRNVNGTKIAETIAGSLTRIGIKTTVAAVPLNVYIAEWRKGRYSFYMHGAGPPPSASLLVPQLGATKDMAKAMGVSNESFYSNLKLDAVIRAGMEQVDNAAREKLLFQAAEMIRDDTAVISLHYEAVVWASRKDRTFEGRSDGRSHAMEILPRR